MPSDPRVRQAMDALVESLETKPSLDDSLQMLTEGAVQAIPGVEYASISLRYPDGRLETVAPTAELVLLSDKTQYQLQQGPCYEAIIEEVLLVSEDIAHDERWPDYGPFAAELGIGAQMAVGLTNSGHARTALNLYASQPFVFTAEAREVAEVFADHAAVAMGLVRTIETLRRGLDSRSTIGMAIGIVMERYQIDRERAFQFLVRVSSSSNVKLREVAEGFVAGLDSRTHHREDAATDTTPGTP